MIITTQDIQEIESLKNKYFNKPMILVIRDSHLWINKISDREKDLIKTLLISYGLFTGGNVDTVRNPELFNDSKAEAVKSILFDELAARNNEHFINALGLDAQRKLTKQDYQIAHDLLSVVSREKDAQTIQDISVLYRGIHSISQNLLQSWIQNEAVFDLGNIISCTWNFSIALGFLMGKRPYKIILTIENKNGIGTVAHNVSRYPGEDEAILSGKVKTKGVRGLKIKFDDKTGFSTGDTKDPSLIISSIMFLNTVKEELSKIPKKDLKAFEIQIGEFTLTNKTPEGRKIIKSLQATESEVLNSSIQMLVEMVEENK